MFRITKSSQISKEIRRIAREQTSKAIQEIDDGDLPRSAKVHTIRKRCKKIRGILRLVRPASEDLYKQENEWFRDTARQLAGLRDAKTMQDTYDSVMEKFAEQVNREAFASIRRRLTLQGQSLLEDTDVDEQLQHARRRFVQARKRARTWKFDPDGFAAIGGGLKKTYARAVEAMERAASNPTAEDFHEWRKRVKYHRYHLRLLRDLWPGPLGERTDEADRLGNLLGADHDLAVLSQHIVDMPNTFGTEGSVEVFQALLKLRSDDLRSQALTLGRRLFAEKPSPFIKRLENYWDATFENSTARVRK